MPSKIKDIVQKLIEEGKTVTPNLDRDFGKMTDEGLDHAKFMTWNTKCLNFLSQIKTGKSVYLDKYLDEENLGFLKRKKIGEKGRAYHSVSIEIFYKLAILEALREDVDSGHFFDEELLITADAFADILEQAEYLLDKNYKDASAVLIGAVLESTLRKLCDKDKLSYSKDTTINPLNDILKKNGVYNALIHKQIVAWADIRNNASHGHFDKYKKEDVLDMLKWVKKLLGNYLS